MNYSDDEYDNIPDYNEDALIQEYEQEAAVAHQQELATESTISIPSIATSHASHPNLTIKDGSFEEICAECRDPSSRPYKTYRDVYGVSVCYECSRREDKYRLVTKTTIKDEFLLSDTAIAENLKHIEKKNEKYGGWAPIKLFLFFQARDLALSIHGSFDEIQKKKQEREVAKLETRVKRLKREREDQELLESVENIPMILARRFRDRKIAETKRRQLKREKKALALEEAEENEFVQSDISTQLLKKEEDNLTQSNSVLASQDISQPSLQSSFRSIYGGDSEDDDDAFFTQQTSESSGGADTATRDDVMERTKTETIDQNKDEPNSLAPKGLKATPKARKTARGAGTTRPRIKMPKNSRNNPVFSSLGMEEENEATNASVPSQVEFHLHDYQPLPTNSSIEECTICGQRMEFETL